ncbi:unnamed protein product [Schistosoma turkestanicum]|nr:unnamed protein product [Schistosoma turkestanicum]
MFHFKIGGFRLSNLHVSNLLAILLDRIQEFSPYVQKKDYFKTCPAHLPDSSDELGSRTSSECRSKGSKLIISSPTTTSHPCLNLLLSGSQAPTQQTDDNAKLTSHYNRGFGASALLASLNATGHQHQTDTHPTRLFQPTVESQQISQLAERNYQQRNLDFTNCSPSLLATNSVINQNSADNNRSSVYVLSTSNRAPNQSLPMHFSYRNLPHGSTKHIQSKRSSFDDGISSNTQVKSNSELSMLEMESIESPTPSDMNSPVESCFANIMEDQGSDSFDLNNITPSINLSSSVGISDSTSDFPHQTPNSSERLQQTTSTSTTAKTMLQTGNKLDSLVQISPVDVNSFFLKESTKANRDDTGMTVSSSCPANVPDDLCMTDNSTSPLQSGSRAPQSVLSESGSSPLGGLNSTPEGTSLPVSHGPLSIGNISSPTSGRNVDDQRVAWMRDRSKKDSHNRIERKRRDYINCQIAELGSLLPEDMFRDGDGKKNKGNILKNSVEFICLLRSELAQIPEVRRETSLAAKVIGQLVKRIQELESVTNVASLQTPHSNRNNSDYQNLYQEWSMLHENNLLHSMPLCSTNSPITRCSFPQSTTAGGGSSPGLSSVGTDEMNSSDTKVVFSSKLVILVLSS